MTATSTSTPADSGVRGRERGFGGAAGMSVGVPHRKQTMALSAISVPQDRHFTTDPALDRHTLLKNHSRVVS